MAKGMRPTQNGMHSIVSLTKLYIDNSMMFDPINCDVRDRMIGHIVWRRGLPHAWHGHKWRT